MSMEEQTMKKIIAVLFFLILGIGIIADAAQRDLEIKGRKLLSPKPPFTLTLPSELNLVHFFSHENPGENSITRVYFLVKTKGKKVEEMLILQIADRASPLSGPMTVPPLRAYTEKRMFLKDRVKKAGVTIDHLIQLMAWNPNAPSLQPMAKEGIIIPPDWALQGQFQFVYRGENAVSFRYSRDVNSFGMKVSNDGGAWEKGSISGNEKRAYEVFQKTFLGMIDTLRIITP